MIQLALTDTEQKCLTMAIRLLIADPESFSMLMEPAPDQSIEQACQALEQRHAYFQRIPFPGNRVGYQLTPRITERFEVDREVRKPMNPSRLRRAYAMLRICTQDSQIRALPLTQTDFETNLADYYTANMNCRSYYLLGDKLGYLVLDAGLEHAWPRLQTKCVRTIVRHQQRPGFTDLLSAWFELTVVTPFESKAKHLRESMGTEERLAGTPVKVLAVPELRHFDRI